MAQRTETAWEPPKRKIGPRSLMTLRQITDRMRRIICASLNSDVDAAVAFRQVRMLEGLRLAIENSDFGKRERACHQQDFGAVGTGPAGELDILVREVENAGEFHARAAGDPVAAAGRSV